MSAADDRENAIIVEARELRDFYISQDREPSVRLFAEDYDFLRKRGAIKYGNQVGGLDAVRVIRGPRKKKARKRRPKESMF